MSPPHPAAWTRVSDGPVHDYQILTVHEMQVRDPRNGSLHPRVHIQAPDWVNVVPITSDGDVVLVRQFRCGIWSNTLELPGGMIDGEESPQEAAARELEEETGYRAERWVPLGLCHPNPAIQNNRLFGFVAQGCRKVHEGRPDQGEDLIVERVSRPELEEKIRRGEITHALVLATLLLEKLSASP